MAAAARPPRFDGHTKAWAVDMALNGVDLAKIARFVHASPAGVLRSIRKEHAAVQARLAEAAPAPADQGDIIEMDEIYTFV